MRPPIHEICSSDTSLQSLLGNGSAFRMYPYGYAEQKPKQPYVVWAAGGGAPENYLGQLPDVDALTTHIDIFAATSKSARDVLSALLDALEPVAHVVSWDGEYRDSDTRAFRLSFTVDWIVSR